MVVIAVGRVSIPIVLELLYLNVFLVGVVVVLGASGGGEVIVVVVEYWWWC